MSRINDGSKMKPFYEYCGTINPGLPAEGSQDKALMAKQDIEFCLFMRERNNKNKK